MNSGFRTRSISIIKKVSKATLLSLVVFTTLFANSSVVFADPLPLETVQTEYADYLNLFTDESGVSGSAILAETSGQITGFAVNLAANFNSFGGDSRATPEWLWNHVDDPFLLQVCQDGVGNTEQYCWIQEVEVYSEKSSLYSTVRPGTYAFFRTNQSQTIKFDFGIVHEDSITSSQGTRTEQYKIWRYSENREVTRLVLSKGNSFTVKLWYPAAKATRLDGATLDGTKAATDFAGRDSRVRTFNGQNGTYIQVGKAVGTVTINDDTVNSGITDNEQLQQNVGSSAATEGDGLPSCGITSIVGCFARFVYYVIYSPIAWIAGFFGMLFDFFVGYGLNDESYRATFAENGWKIVRDIANTFFIIILVYTGFATVFRIGGINIKKVLPSVILSALAINFSLFGTRVVIDISNIVSRVFYNQIQICADKDCAPVNGQVQYKTNGTGGYRPISEAIVSTFNPQRIFQGNKLLPSSSRTTNDIKEVGSDTQFGAVGQGAAPAAPRRLTDNETAGYFIVVTLFAAAIMFFVMKMFWKMAFLFLGRVVGLYIAMIFSPFAIISYGNIPIVDRLPGELRWKGWVEELTKNALMAPTFLFFLYIIYTFMQTGADFVNISGLSMSTTSFLEGALYVCIPMGMIYIFITKGADAASKLAGSVAQKIQGAIDGFTGGVGAVTGLAAGIATGGAALIGRNTIGRLGSRIAESSTLRDMAARDTLIGGRIARAGLRMGTSLSDATFDARNTRVGQRTIGQLGDTNSAATRFLGFGTNRTQGGYRGAVQREEASLNARGDIFQVSGRSARRMDNENKRWEDAYKAAREQAELAALQNGTQFDENAFRTTYEATNPRVRSSTEVNRERETMYQQSLARGTVLSRFSDATPGVIPGGWSVAGAGGIATGAAPLAGGAALAASAIIGQGAIQSEARSAVAASRQSRAGETDPAARARKQQKLQNKIDSLQRNKLRVYQTLQPVIAATGIAIDSLTVADITDHMRLYPNFQLRSSANAVIAERNRINTDLEDARKKYREI